jgi:hypothetical protein
MSSMKPGLVADRLDAFVLEKPSSVLERKRELNWYQTIIGGFTDISNAS